MPSRTGFNGKRHATQQSLNAAIKSICDVMRRSNCAGAMKYVPELTWILFLRILDEREAHEADEAEALDIAFTPTIKKPYRRRDWAAPDCAFRQDTKAEKIEDAVYDLKAVNPNRASEEDTRTPAQLLDFIDAKGHEADAALTRLRSLIDS